MSSDFALGVLVSSITLFVGGVFIRFFPTYSVSEEKSTQVASEALIAGSLGLAVASLAVNK